MHWLLERAYKYKMQLKIIYSKFKLHEQTSPSGNLKNKALLSIKH